MTKPTYEQLEARLEMVGERAGVSEKLLEEVQKAYQAQAEELAAAGKTIEKLAAEGAVLREACGGDGRYVDCPGCSHSQYIESPEAPATDAAIAEIRASAVEHAANHLYGAGYICETLLAFAQQLRAEASK